MHRLAADGLEFREVEICPTIRFKIRISSSLR
jgi:hypothetical protein